MEKLVNDIISFLKYLNDECKLYVSFHLNQEVHNCLPHHINTMILSYNCHRNAYCIKVKVKNKALCLMNQEKILQKSKPREAFCNTCHCGVCEYIYPIGKEERVVGFVAVSGYRRAMEKEHQIVDSYLWENNLSAEMPIKLCDAVIPPLVVMLEQMLIKYSTETENEYNSILRFLSEYHTKITLSDLASHFKRSKSHISHLFKTKSGISIRAYCNDLKLHDALHFLITTDLPITEIAFNVGFDDTSYFICLFKKKFGMSPLKYRKLKQNNFILHNNIRN
ncbi:MAG: helix-turn-helix transcriptional regulator [Clostridia bacterium]|nr:helix-turn-helix transcriptional regulator [Clostridia bacterium]